MKIRVLLCVSLMGVALSGCVARSEFDKAVNRNKIQYERIQELEAAEGRERMLADKLRSEFDLYKQQEGLALLKVEALEAALRSKQAELEGLLSQVGTFILPPEITSALEEWVQQTGSDLVSFDPERGIVRFKSDLLFNPGEDVVQPTAHAQIVELSKILSTPMALEFDVLIVGHTDDIPIRRAQTRSKHPTNWHLSAHRAISVQRIMVNSQMAPTRVAVMGLGEFRPLEANKPGSKGNPKNRRVEIYIVPAGQMQPAYQTTTAANT